jgi:hypothetical protein
MKTTLLIIAGAITLLVISCTQPTRTQTEVVLMHDRTQEFSARIIAADITPLFELDKDKWSGARFRSLDVTDVSYNPATEFVLEKGGSQLLSNSFDRDKQAKKFESEVTVRVDSLSSDTVGKPRSSIYIPLARELNLLAKSTSEKKYLILFSDLLENTDGVSFYRKQTLSLLQVNPDTIASALLAKMPLENLSGITVYLIYQPENALDDDTFRITSNFFKTLLEQHGATVIVGANLTQ